MTASALSIPEPLPDDPDAVTTALETAAIFGMQGDAREAVRWVRRAAELAGDEGNDARALNLARVAADLTTQIGSDSAAAPANPSAPAGAEPMGLPAMANPAISAALDDALGTSTGPNAAQVTADGNGSPVAAGWSPPVPPPPLGEGGSEPASSPPHSPIGSAQPPAQSLREALQRFSQQATQPSASVPVVPVVPAAPKPDPQQQPALAALVESIVQQAPRTRSLTPLLSNAEERAMLADTLPGAQVPEPEIERTQPDILRSRAIPSSEPVPEAVTDPRTVPAVEVRGGVPSRSAADQLSSGPDSEVEPPSLPMSAKPVSSRRGPAGSRQAVRVSIAATTEKGVYLVELLKDDSSPAPGSHEAFVVLTDPAADPFDD